MGDNPLAKAHRLSTCTGGQTMVQLLPLGVYHVLKQSTFRENANNEESDQTGFFLGRGVRASDGSV